MNTIEITHNPFTVNTSFVFNGQIPAEGCKLSSYKESRLQAWIEILFEELDELFNGDNRYQIIFKGVESDYLDILEAAEKANEEGMLVEVEWHETKPTEQRLDEIRSLVKEARENPDFDNYIQNDKDASASIREAFNRDFDVYVVATMSSGKSTLINAMLGSDLLPAANEATTATIARITDNDSMDGVFSAKRFDTESNLVGQSDNVTAEILKEWNLLPDTKLIDIEGRIQAIEEREEVRLVLTDTPGPNNSQDEEHQRTTMRFIQDSRRNPLILYVLNATQLGAIDDRNLLGLVAKTMRRGGKQSKDRFVFVVNKMDMFDPEAGEDIAAALERVKAYLEQNGILNPQIYPVSANFTRLMRKSSEEHTRKERNDYKALADLFSEEPSMDMLQYMPITSRVHRSLEAKKYSSLMLASGVPAVEAMIDEYIDKYSFPHRLNRAYDVLNTALDKGLNETELDEQLDMGEMQLKYIEEEVEALKKRQKVGFDVKAYKDKLECEGKVLPASIKHKLIEIEAAIEFVFRDIKNSFIAAEATVNRAENLLIEAEDKLKFEYQKLINEFENVFISNQELITKDLHAEYQKYIIDIFSDVKDLDLPILEGIKKSIGGISLNLSLQKGEVRGREFIKNTKKESISSWYKPWTWGDTKQIHTYGTVEYVDLEDLWSSRSVSITNEFNQVIDKAKEEIEEAKNRLVDQFIFFMDQEFNLKFSEIMNSLQDKIKDRDIRKEAIEQAKIKKKWINEFKSKLNSTLAV